MSSASLANKPITALLNAWEEGDSSAVDHLAPIIYDSLCKQADFLLRKERPNHTLTSHDLVHEAYLKLFSDKDRNYQNRQHFFVISAKVLRNTLIQYARARGAQKRGGQFKNFVPQFWDDIPDPQTLDFAPVLAEAIEALAEKDKRRADIVEMHYFAGFTVEEIARNMKIGTATVKRNLSFSRAWLRKWMGERAR